MKRHLCRRQQRGKEEGGITMRVPLAMREKGYPRNRGAGPKVGLVSQVGTWVQALQEAQRSGLAGSLSQPHQQHSRAMCRYWLLCANRQLPHTSLVFLRASGYLGFHRHNFGLHIISVYLGFLFYLTALPWVSNQPQFLLLMTRFSFHLSIQVPQTGNLIGQLTRLWADLSMLGHIIAGLGCDQAMRKSHAGMAAQGLWCVASRVVSFRRGQWARKMLEFIVALYKEAVDDMRMFVDSGSLRPLGVSILSPSSDWNSANLL